MWSETKSNSRNSQVFIKKNLHLLLRIVPKRWKHNTATGPHMVPLNKVVLLLTVGSGWLAVGGWQRVVGSWWRLAVGSWWLAVGCS